MCMSAFAAGDGLRQWLRMLTDIHDDDPVIEEASGNGATDDGATDR